MSLASQISALATRAAAESKALRTLISGNAADLSALNTTATSNLVAAINEMVATKQDHSALEADVADTVGTAGALDTALNAAYAERLDFQVRDYGTFDPGATWQTNRDTMQAANDAAYAAGGGRVLLPPGSFQVKGVIQDSRVEFYGPHTLLAHPDGNDTDIIAARVRTTTGTVAAASTVLIAASALVMVLLDRAVGLRVAYTARS